MPQMHGLIPFPDMYPYLFFFFLLYVVYMFTYMYSTLVPFLQCLRCPADVHESITESARRG